MKKYIFGLVLALSGFTANAGLIGIDGSVNIVNACKHLALINRTCTINESGINLTLTCSDKFYLYAPDSTLPKLGCYDGTSITITSNAPFVVEGASSVKYNDDFSAVISLSNGAFSGIKFNKNFI